MKNKISWPALLLGVAGLFSPLSGSAASSMASRPPNVIFLLADDLGYGDVGAFGQKLIKTPNLDRLADEGTKFTQAYAGATVCAPSRCALMTGKHGGHAYIRGNREIKPEGQEPMPADTITVAHIMQRAGYTTGITGKWGLGKPDSASVPNKMGFDYFYGYNCQLLAHNYYPDHLWRNDQKVPLDGKSYSDDLMAKETLQFIRRSKDQPFFLYVAYTLPHGDVQVPNDEPYSGELWTGREKKIAAMITRLDTDVGQIMALLKELNLDDNTLVIFNSDNGAVYREAQFHHSGELRGFKRDMYEGGIRSPSIARWPGHIKAGATSDQIWTFWDVMPTLAELVGQKVPADIDGISVLPSWLEGKNVPHPPLYFEFHERGFNQAARIGDWKAVRMGTKLPIELYDLKKDPSEKNNVAAQNPEVVKKFEDYLKTARVDSALWPITEKEKPAGINPKQKQKQKQKADDDGQ